ncbi:MAG TPA: hypothetical protein VGM29_09975, partial [Polyangiaceae bacterium]
MIKLPEGSRRRRLAIAGILYALSTIVFLICAAQDTLHGHTPYNHFALLADAFRHGRLDLAAPPPAYTGNNDFARFGGKWFVVFPPFPALLLVPLTWLAGSAERVRDGQFFLWLAGLTPACLFLALEKLRRFGRAATREWHGVLLSVLFAFGTVYFFSTEQGTVWYAAHVVGAALAALYLLCALEAERPLLAGVALGLGFATRAPLLFAFPLFALEAVRVRTADAEAWQAGSVRRVLSSLAYKRLALDLLLFALPIACVLGASFVYNQKRFGSPFEVGYRFLGIAWQTRIEKWGLFSYHYLGKNLAVVLTGLPFRNPDGTWQVNAHGLALWLTTPLYLWLLWPRRRGAPQLALWLTVA